MHPKYKFGKIDIHVHLVRDSSHDRTPGMSVTERLIFNERMGIEKSIILSAMVSGMGKNIISNDDAAEICGKDPAHFAWMCNVCPTGDKKTYHLLQTYKEKGACGIGEFADRIHFTDPAMAHLLSCCEELQLPLLFHMAPEACDPFYGVVDAQGLPGLEAALKAHPKLIFVGHSQPFWFEMGQNAPGATALARNHFPFTRIKEGRLVELMRRYDNLHLDLSANSGANALMRDPEYAVRFIDEFQDRMMFGTDAVHVNHILPLAPWLDFMLIAERIPEAVYHKIAYSNAQKLFF